MPFEDMHHIVIWSPVSDGGPIVYSAATAADGSPLGVLWADLTTGCGWIDARGAMHSSVDVWRGRLIMAAASGQSDWQRFVRWWTEHGGGTSWTAPTSRSSMQAAEDAAARMTDERPHGAPHR